MGPELIKQLNAPNCVFTWDALNTQIKTVAAISAEADYVGALKKNQQTFYKEVKEFLDDTYTMNKIIENEQYLKIVKKEHNAIVTREYYMTNDIEWFYDKNKWKKLKSFGKEDKTIEKLDGTKSYETRYFITSLNEDIDLFSYAIKAHWGVENNLHAPLDIVFKEDKNKTLEKNGAKSLGVIRRIALIILKLAQPYYGDSLSSMRYKLSLDFDNEIEKIFKLLDMTALKQQLISKSD
jgi:predicted transposase YbfD/YdcC